MPLAALAPWTGAESLQTARTAKENLAVPSVTVAALVVCFVTRACQKLWAMYSTTGGITAFPRHL